MWSRSFKHKGTMRGERGFSLPEVAVATAISAMVIFGTSSIFLDSAKVESGQERQFWLAARRMELQSLIRSQQGWDSIIAQNPAMNCFNNTTSCAAYSTAQPLRLPIDAVVLDGASSTVGMSNKGEFCQNFDSTNGNSACPIGLRLSWVALCDDANCKHAQPKLTVQFQLKELGKPVQDLRSYDLVVFKDPKLESLNDVCTSMGGTLAGTSCSIASLSTTCDPSNSLGAGATYPLGFDNTGAVICGKPNPGNCAASDVAIGFDAQGGIVCAPACL